MASLGMTMNPDGTLSTESGDHSFDPKNSADMVHGWKAFKKIFGAVKKLNGEGIIAGKTLDEKQVKALRRVGNEFKEQAKQAKRDGKVTPMHSLGSGDVNTGPPLAKYVTSRERVFSLGLDPEVELIAAEWFESLGYVSLHGDTHFAKGYWGGVVSEKDARLAVSVCTGTSDVSVVSGYDFSNWLPVSSVVDSLVLDFPDSKFVLFETPVEQWLNRIQFKAAEARKKGVKCGCISSTIGGVTPTQRSTSSACGDANHHVCDAYPCIWEKAFSNFEFDIVTWSEAYVNHIAKVKTSVPADRLLVVPLVGAHSPVTVARALGEFVGLTTTPDLFASQHPFEPHLMSFQSESRWETALFIGVGVVGLVILVAPNPWAGSQRRAGYEGFN